MHKNGFTLIELLVVIGIIGLLSSVILVNVNGARLKASDANIQSYLHQLRNAAEMEYIKNGENYSFVCEDGNNTLSNDGEIGTLETAIIKENGNYEVACFESEDGLDFAASSPLRARQGKYWCVQSAGLSMELDSNITTEHCE